MSSKCIVTTTINPPTVAIRAFAALNDWTLIIVGDKKSPHADYEASDRWVYLTPEHQETAYPALSSALGWNCIARRNIGLVEAFRRGADVIAVVDDDNIPLEGWGRNLLVGTRACVPVFTHSAPVCDPLAVTEHSHLWHRGFPIELLAEKNHVQPLGEKEVFVGVQADLWNGDPDIDAIARIALRPIVEFEPRPSYTFDKPAPFNSQNSFLAVEVLADYFCFPFIGRMEDIWGAYYLQARRPDVSVVFGAATVRQDRNQHQLAKDLQDEMLGYQHGLDFVTSGCNLQASYFPQASREAYETFRELILEGR